MIAEDWHEKPISTMSRKIHKDPKILVISFLKKKGDLREIFRKSPISSSRHDRKTILSNSNLYLILEEGEILWKKKF